MLFLQRYQLKRLLCAGEVNTFSASKLDTQDEVYLHMLGDPKKHREAGQLVQSLLVRAPLIPEMIEIGELAGTWFIVTQPIDPFPGLREWLEPRIAQAEAEAHNLPQSVSVPAFVPVEMKSPISLQAGSGMGEYTRLFERAAVLPTAPNPAASELTKEFGSLKPAARLEVAPPEAGALTKLFGPDPAGAAAPPAQVQPLPGEPKPPSVAGEFTSLFEPERAAATPQVPPHTLNHDSATQNPGEFTRLFQPERAASATPHTPTQPLETDPATHSTGEFTRLFSPEQAGSAIPLGKPQTLHSGVTPQAGAGEFTRLFEPERAGSAKLSGLGTAAPAPAPQPGEFTRMFEPEKAAHLLTQNHVGSAEFTPASQAAPAPPAAPSLDTNPDLPTPHLAPHSEFEAIFPTQPRPLASTPKPVAPPEKNSTAAPDWKEPLAPASAKGEFSDFFNSPYKGRPVDIDRQNAAHARDAAPLVEKPFREASEFTRIFGPSATGSPSGITPVPPARRPGAGGASQLFGGNAEPRPAPLSQEPAAASEYTRIISASKPSAPVPEPNPSPTAVVAPKSGNTLRIALIVMAVVCGLALLSAILFVVFRHP